jgi:hypothetical protein
LIKHTIGKKVPELFRHFFIFMEKQNMRQNINIVASDFHQRYINLVKHEDICDSIKTSALAFEQLLQQIQPVKRDFAYAEGKWTLKQMLQHLVDAERVFALRAVWFARKDPSPLPGFDENLWGANAVVTGRSWESLVEEFTLLRKATILLFESFADNELNTTGVANNHPITVAAVGYISAGHLQHHMGIIRERYGVVAVGS